MNGNIQQDMISTLIKKTRDPKENKVCGSIPVQSHNFEIKKLH